MANEKIIDVDLEAHDGDLHAAMQRFQQDLTKIQLQISKIGSNLNLDMQKFNAATAQSVRELQKAESTLNTYQRLSNRDQLSPAETGRLQRQMASQQIRDLRDRSSLEDALGQAQGKRIQLLGRISEETNKKTRQGLLAELQLQDHIESKVNSRIRAVDRLNATMAKTRQAEINAAYRPREATTAQVDARTQGWIQADNAAAAQANRDAKQRRKDEADFDKKQAADRIASEEALGAIKTNRQQREAELAETIRKRDTITGSERLAMTKKISDLQVRGITDRSKLEDRMNSSRALADSKTLEMQNAKTASAKRQLKAVADAADYDAKRAESRLKAMDRQDSSVVQAQRERALNEESIRHIRNTDLLKRSLDEASQRRTSLNAQLENTHDAKQQRALIQRIQTEKQLEANIRNRITLLEREARAAARASPPSPVVSERKGLGLPDFGTVVGRTAMYGGAAAAIYGVVGAMQQGIAFAIQLEDKLANLQAIAGLGDERMEGLSGSILEVARNSKYATLELVEATTVLAQAGLTATEMSDALQAVSNLAIATGTELSTASETVTSAIGGFQLQASEAERISDAMVSALNRSKLTIQQVQQAIQYVGATAYESDIKLEEVIGAAGAMANAGIARGSTIGTGMRQLLVDLQDPSEKLVTTLTGLGLSLDDIDVKTKGFVPVLEKLRDAGFGSSQAYGALETRAAAAFLVLSSNTDTIYDLIEAQQMIGVAAEAAEVSMNSLAAQWVRFKNNLGESVATTAAGPLDVLKESLSFLSNEIERHNELLKNSDEERMQYIEWLRKQKEELDASGDAVGGFLVQLDLWLQTAQIHNTALLGGADALEHFTSATQEQTEVMYSNLQTIDLVDESIVRLLTQQERYADGSEALRIETLSLTRQFDGLAKYLDFTKNNFFSLINAMGEYRAEAARTAAATANLARANAVQQRASGLDLANQSRAEIDFRDTSSGFLRAFTAYRANNTNPGLLNNLQDEIAKLPAGANRRAAEEYVRGMAGAMTANISIAQATREQERAEYANSSEGRSIYAQRTEARARLDSDSVRVRGTVAGRDPATSADNLAKGYEARAGDDSLSAAARELAAETAIELRSIAQQHRAQNTLEEADPATARPDRTAERAARRNQRNEVKIAQEALEAAKLELDEVLEILKNPLDLGDFSATAADLYESFNEWESARLAAMREEIEAGEMSVVQQANLATQVQREIEVRRRELSQALTESVVALYDTMIEEAEKAFERTMLPFEQSVQVAEGRVQSYDRTYNQGNVPDYVRSEQEFQVNLTAEERDRQRLAALQEQIEAQRDALLDLRRAASFANRGAEAAAAGPEALETFRAEMEGGELTSVVTILNQQIPELSSNIAAFAQRDLQILNLKVQESEDALGGMSVEVQALNASLQTAQIPDFATGLQMAAQNYARLNNLNRTFEEEITMGLGGAFSETHGIMNNFFNDLITKPMSAASAFQSMGQSIIQMMARMAAEAAAKQIMSLVLSFLPGAPTGGSTANLMPDVMSTFAANPSMFYDGGQVGNAGGGMVNQGISSRDSVLTGLAKGEFVVRKTAVDSVGAGFLRSINSRGAEALKGLGGNTTIMAGGAPARQDMSVYIVAPEEKPQLGANDVIAIIDRNILKDGSTKRLIRHVSQGG